MVNELSKIEREIERINLKLNRPNYSFAIVIGLFNAFIFAIVGYIFEMNLLMWAYYFFIIHLLILLLKEYQIESKLRGIK